MNQNHEQAGGVGDRPDAGKAEGAGVPWHRLPERLPALLTRLAAERSEGETERERRFRSRNQAAESAHREQTAAVQKKQRAEAAGLEEFAKSSLEAYVQAFEHETTSARGEREEQHRAITADAIQKADEAKAAHEQARWEANAAFESADLAERNRHGQITKALEGELRAVAEFREASAIRRETYRGFGPFAEGGGGGLAITEPVTLEAVRQSIADVEAKWNAIEELRLPRIAGWPGLISFFLVPLVLLIGPLLFALRWPMGAIATLGISLVLGGLLTVVLRSRARSDLRTRLPELDAAIAKADALAGQAVTSERAVHEKRAVSLRETRDAQVRLADDRFRKTRAAIEEARVEGLARLEARTVERLKGADSEKVKATAAREKEVTRLREELSRWHETESRRIEEELARHRKEAEERYERDWNALASNWSGGLVQVGRDVDAVAKETEARSMNLARVVSPEGLPSEVPPAVRFGSVHLDMERVPHGIPAVEVLREPLGAGWDVPALLTFDDRASLLIRASGAGKAAGVEVLQGAMLRYLTSLPPGKVRFILIDPVGLGRHFAAFMHLADYSELLVTSRIWTEPHQIEQRLADLSLHMENVIQQFLRNEFATLEEYNREAGEVAEPYRVLVISHFPAGFHEAAAQRLMSIATGGSRCGVHTLILVDEDQPLPRGVNLADLEAQAQTLIWDQKESRFTWKHPEFSAFALTPDRPPDDETLTALLHQVGEAARRSSRVEVPFEVIAPAEGQWWEGDTRHGVEIPLGRSGATKLQALQLGRGTAQHALVAGRTGSGKSTLLHALITNAALIYGPDQVEFYLIDFKKGVEFKTYAEHELPHARVIAIESEREFGVSVLQRLDDELRRRGELFRSLNVQDLPSYRTLPEGAPMPRILLIVDEFQEFFVEDDKLAQEAALLLDRLVRQGRAFGIHALLGSQTLGGAFSLARSTLGQMAVRIALQCSEADAHLILSEENAAARLLSRPGEAIYNDANGMIEGNHVFQVVWLSEEQRAGYLAKIQEHERERGSGVIRPQIVFEGNVPSDIRRNARMAGLIAADAWPVDGARSPVAWLGEAVAIKDATTARFRRQGGNNLLLIGQDADGARGIFAGAVVGLAAQMKPTDARFVILDGTPDDNEAAGRLAEVAGALPHEIQVGTPAELKALLSGVAEELARRMSAPGPAATIFVFLFDGSRFRDLRRSDEFSFGSREAEANPADQLAELLREGPAVGIHVIAWFDTVNNLQRVIDRTGLREFEMRVLFQMSANDSTNLIDTPVANRLGTHRALFASEELGTLEKFRPYHLPDSEWLKMVKERLARADLGR